jgi:hypothetical protein
MKISEIPLEISTLQGPQVKHDAYSQVYVQLYTYILQTA